VASFLMDFGKKKQQDKEAMVSQWIHYIKAYCKDDLRSIQKPFLLPYYAFTKYEEELLLEGIAAIDVPDDILEEHRICRSALMSILGVGRRFLKTSEMVPVDG
jgi:hypothetical protein